MVGQAPIYMLTGIKALETQQICDYRHATKPVDLFCFSSSNNFANLASFAKVFVSLQFIIPCFTRQIS